MVSLPAARQLDLLWKTMVTFLENNIQFSLLHRQITWAVCRQRRTHQAGHTTCRHASNNYHSCSCQDDFMYLTLKQYKLNIWLWEGGKITSILRWNKPQADFLAEALPWKTGLLHTHSPTATAVGWLVWGIFSAFHVLEPLNSNTATSQLYTKGTIKQGITIPRLWMLMKKEGWV